MSAASSYFNKFLGEIRLTDSQVEDCKKGHSTLRDRLHADEDLKDVIVESFLQGSYRRSTAVRPFEDKKKSDVDVIVVTNMDRSNTSPQDALNRFKPFLDKYYKGKYKAQGRSWGIELSYVELDLVPTSAPSEALSGMIKSASVMTDQTLEEAIGWRFSPSWQTGKSEASASLKENNDDAKWRKEPLWIPDRDTQKWDKTHPLAQIESTQVKNANCNGHYVNVVKCIKWWRTTQQPDPKYPKSYPLEHLCCLNCIAGIDSVANGVVSTLENIRDRYSTDAALKKTPFVPDHGVPEHNVLHRVNGNDFAAFHKLVKDAAGLARRAYDEKNLRKSIILWRELFGDRFPEPPEAKDEDEEKSCGSVGGYTPRKEVSVIGGGRFAI